jgi:hypothetical protein
MGLVSKVLFSKAETILTILLSPFCSFAHKDLTWYKGFPRYNMNENTNFEALYNKLQYHVNFIKTCGFITSYF